MNTTPSNPATILVIGCNGQLGSDMMRVFENSGYRVAGVDFPEIDITDSSLVSRVVARYAPGIIVNPAAYTAVDDAEKNRDRAFAVNADGAGNVAAAARDCGATLFHISTDYVFDGTKPTPYVESDPTGPQGVYGASKLAGEERIRSILPNHVIVRIAWLYGAHGSNFVKNIVRIARQNSAAGKPLRVVDDQRGNPTHTVDVCRQLQALFEVREYGVYHATSEGACTWYEFARYFLDKYKVACEVVPCSTADFPRPAPRPANSALENARLKAMGKNTMPEWRQAFDAFFKQNPELNI